MHWTQNKKLAYLCTESTEKGKPEVAQREGEVLIEEVSEELAHPIVRPPSVNKQEPLQETELSDGIVRREDGLHAFLATDPNSDMGS